MAKRRCIDCPKLIDKGKSRCLACARVKDKERGTRQERGYDAEHVKTRADLAPKAIGKPCHLCCELMLAGQPLALDHTEDRLDYRGMAHLRCNAADGGRRSR